jgi:hypothetical protein
MRPPRKEIGLAVIGCGTIGRIRAEFARDYPGIGWLGLCDTNAEHFLQSLRPPSRKLIHYNILYYLSEFSAPCLIHNNRAGTKLLLH